MTKPTTVRWRILALLTVAGFVMYVLKTNMSIAGKGLMPGLGLSQIQFGVVLAAMNLGYAIFQFPGGLFGDRFGARRTLTLLAVAWGLFTLLTGLVPATGAALAYLIGVQFLLGSAMAPLYPVTGGGTTCAWFPVAGWAFPTGLQNAGLTLGTAAAAPLVAWILDWLGWRQSFFVTAPLAFGLAAFWWWYVRDSPGQHPSCNAQEIALINEGRRATGAFPQTGLWKLLIRDRNVLLLTVSYFCDCYVFYFFSNWIFLYLVDGRGFKVLEGGLLSSLPWLTGTVTAVLGGLVCDRVSRRVGMGKGCRRTAALGMVSVAVLVAAASGVRSPIAAVLLLALALGGQQFSDASYWAAAISVSGPNASAACGVMNTGGNVVGSVAALVIPLLVKRFGWGAALASGAAFALVAAVLWIWIRADEPIEMEEVA